MNKAIGNRRLLKLAEFLRTVPRRRFNYMVWVGLDWKGAADLSCGTTACALGWATTMPYFRRLGLRLLRGENDVVARVGLASDPDNWQPMEAASEVFGITEEESAELFSPNDDEGDATPKYVAKKIEKFVAARA